MLGEQWGSVGEAIGSTIGWLLDAVATGLGGLAAALNWFLDAIGNAVVWCLHAVGDAVVWAVTPVVGWLDGPLAWAGTAAVNIVDWIGTAAANVVAWTGARLDPIVDPIGNELEPAGEILAEVWPPVVAGIAVVIALRTVRWLLLLWRGRTPRVQIANFAWTSSDDADREATWVTSLFREQLAALRLDALDPLPDRAPGAPLVEIVEGVGQGIGRNVDIGKALGRLFQAIWPDAAYEVWGTLRAKEGGGGRISVQLVERRRGNRTLLNVALEQASWQDGAREAAMAVAGALYPQVRRSDRGPWTLWKEIIPRELMGAYHAARSHEEADRLEHALAAYHAALDQDPLNPNLRLKIAMLQERLELNLDAWVTYEAIVDESDRRAWQGPDRRVYLLALYRLAVMLSNGRVAEQWVKHATVPKGEGTLRDDERRERRKELRMSLERDSLFTKRPRIRLPSGIGPASWFTSSRIVRAPSTDLLAMLRAAGAAAEEEAGKFSVFADPDQEQPQEGKERARKIDAVLQILSLRYLEELDAWLRISFPVWPRQWAEWWVRRATWRQWLSRPEFSKSSIRTSKLLVRIRIAASLERQFKRRDPHSWKAGEGEKAVQEIRDAHQTLTRRWPFPAANPWRRTIHWLAPRRRWANLRDDSWQLHYNAACATASVLRDDSVLSAFTRAEQALQRQLEPLEGKRRKRAMGRWEALPRKTTPAKVIERAVAELEEYAHRAGSHRVAAQADWLAIDDPDLEGLRRKPDFKLWASHHLPRTLPPDLPTRKTDVKRFTVRVVHDGARLFAEAWRERADRADPSAAEIVGWWREERRAWELLGNACREHLSWEERLGWLRVLQDQLPAGEHRDGLDLGHEARGTAAAETVNEEIFETVAELTGARRSTSGSLRANGPDPTWTPEADTVLAWICERATEVSSAHENGERRADGRGSLLFGVERRQALKVCRLWSRLADAFEAELAAAHRDEESDGCELLEARIERIRSELKAPAI